MWSFVLNMAKARVMSKIADRAGKGGSLGANIASGVMDKENSKPDPAPPVGPASDETTVRFPTGDMNEQA